MASIPERLGATLDAPIEIDDFELELLLIEESILRPLGGLALYENPRVALQSNQLVIPPYAYDFNTELVD